MNSHSLTDLNEVICTPELTIKEAMLQLDRAGTRALAVCSEGMQLQGLLTDGDIRRAVMNQTSLDAPCVSIATRKPVVSVEGIPHADALRLMTEQDIEHLPLVDADGRLVDLLLRSRLAVAAEHTWKLEQRLRSVIVSPEATIAEVLRQMNTAGTGAVVVCSAERRLLGTVTDGDVRRAVLKGTQMNASCDTIAAREPRSVRHPVTARSALVTMQQHDINHLPVVDEAGRVVDFLLRRELVGEAPVAPSAVIMAGGQGQRLRPLTEDTPKPMLPVGDRPLLERTIEQLRSAGIKQVALTTHYLSERIVEHFGSGEAHGIHLNYCEETHPLGTAGGLKQIEGNGQPIVVINGDILCAVSYEGILAYHRHHAAALTVGVRPYAVTVPYGVVESNEERVTGIKEKPTLTYFVNAGIYVIDPSARDLIPDGQRFDMTDLMELLINTGRTVVSFPITEYWLDIGTPKDYQRANEDARAGMI